MAEELDGTVYEYTYTYDQFTVFFHGDRIFIGRKDYPIGQCCVDILNLDEAVLDEIDQRAREFIPAAICGAASGLPPVDRLDCREVP